MKFYRSQPQLIKARVFTSLVQRQKRAEEGRGGKKKRDRKKENRKAKKRKKNMRRVQSVVSTRDVLQFDFWHAQLLPFLAENGMRRLIPLCHLCEVARQPAEREPGSVRACGRPLLGEKLSERVASVFVSLLFIHSFIHSFFRRLDKSAAHLRDPRMILFRGFTRAHAPGSRVSGSG